MSWDPLDKLKEHREWLAGLRLVERVEWIALGVAAAHLIACLILLAWHKFPLLILIEITAVHLVFIAASLLTAPRSFTIGCLGATALSLMFTMAYALTDPASFGDINHGYNVLGFLALLAAVWGLIVHGGGWRRMGKYQDRDDFKWLITRAPFTLRYMVHLHVRRLK